MEVMQIIKDAFVFPSKDMRTLLIYVLLSIVASIFIFCGTIAYIISFIDPQFFLFGGLAFIVAMLIGWIMAGYLISVVKSGIDRESMVPNFVWWDNFISGFDNCIVSIVYFIIPAFLTFVVGYATNIHGNVLDVCYAIFAQIANYATGASTVFAYDAIYMALFNLMISLAITLTAALIFFIIFSFIQTMAVGRLANTGSLGQALNVMEAAKDIKRIGIGKVIILVVLLIVIMTIIHMVLSAIFSILPILSILSIIITPYLIFVTYRAVGLLYSDIA